tara:strand:- start:236 stop:436 length:201 start_codon:yes stop_codon:yes gene_type:complete
MTTIYEMAQEAAANFPTCPDCGERLLRGGLNNGEQICRYHGAIEKLETYGELEEERYKRYMELRSK